ncbi:type IV secretory system conjugative DNA transfer family protein [Nocardia sp. XZ_19_369]|uniref:type IV secretory system conjugative DNA transfer family protein n=1 Tax=Nocardia sp. XZ_19_369 TaxID=2769487 RepID=UPI00188E3782|nr:TraM recognition domain-containing protein [Nocardia sp. XZ_19_369]
MTKAMWGRGSEVALGIRAFLWVVAGLAAVVVALHIENARSTVRQGIPANPITVLDGLLRGELYWSRGATAMVIVEAAIAGIGWLILVLIRRLASRGRPAIDSKARFMASGKALGPLTAASARRKADELGVCLGFTDAPGVLIGTSVAGRQRLYGTYEDLHLDIWGRRQGKSTCRAIPAILDAIGPVVAASTKRDIVDATRDVRAGQGSRIWVFDPHNVAGEAPSWFWDPLAWVGGDAVRAARLAAHFAEADNRSDGGDYFEIEAEELLATLFLAASVDRRPISQVWEWVTYSQDLEPVELLRQHRHHFAAAGLAAVYNADWRPRYGIFGTAKKMVRCLRFPDLHPWVGRISDDQREFNEHEFVDHNETLYALSAAGTGSSAPLVSALIESVLDVAVRKAWWSVPLLAVLDDAANVVRRKDFPQWYEQHGSRGAIVMAMLQSWAQGVRRWGHDGMNELWSAANIKVVGAGVDDVPFLRDRVDGIGGCGIGVSELRSLPRERAVLFASGAPPVLIETAPWWTGPYADDVRRSIDVHRPSKPTLMSLLNTAAPPETSPK